MRPFVIGLFVLALWLVPSQAARAENSNPPPTLRPDALTTCNRAAGQILDRACDRGLPVSISEGDIIGAGIIYLYANDEAKNSSLINALKAIEQLEGKYILPGQTFSFNREAKLLQYVIPYDYGPDSNNQLVKAGGVCLVATMIATAAYDAGLPFVDERGKWTAKPIAHGRYYKYYHQVNRINGRLVPIVEASVWIQRHSVDQPWQSVRDLRFVNTSGRTLILHFEPSFTYADLDPSKPLGLIQRDHYLKVELRTLPNPYDAWLHKAYSASNH